MEEFRIEAAKEADIPFMLELWQDTPGVGIGPGDEDTSLAAFIQKNPSTCLLLKSGGILMGTVLGGFDGRRGYIYHLVVHKDYRRQGWGGKILREAIRRLEALKARKIHLFVFKNNSSAMAFYLKQDWIKRQDIEVFSFKGKE